MNYIENIVLLNLANIALVFKLRHDLLIISLKVKHFLVLGIADFQHRVLLLLDLPLQVHIVLRRVHQHVPDVLGQQHVHHVNLLNDDSVRLELLAHLVANLRGHFGFDVAHSVHLDFLDEVTEVLLTLLLEQLLETIRSEVVEELNDIVLFVFRCTANVEVDADAERHVHVVFCWHVVHWAFESDCVLGDECGYTLVARVEPVRARTNDAIVSSAGLLESVNTIRHILLANAAAMILF